MLCRALALVVALPLALAACPGDGDPPKDDASLVVGVQSDDFGSLVASVHVVVKQDGAVVRDETLATVPNALPKEIVLTGTAGARVDVSAEA
jgi:hypothetical protein